MKSAEVKEFTTKFLIAFIPIFVAIDAIGKQNLSKVTFESTLDALDNIQNEATIAFNKTVKAYADTFAEAAGIILRESK